MADDKQTVQPDDTVLGGDAGVPGTAGSAAGGTDDAGAASQDEDTTKPPER